MGSRHRIPTTFLTRLKRKKKQSVKAKIRGGGKDRSTFP